MNLDTIALKFGVERRGTKYKTSTMSSFKEKTYVHQKISSVLSKSELLPFLIQHYKDLDSLVELILAGARVREIPTEVLDWVTEYITPIHDNHGGFSFVDSRTGMTVVMDAKFYLAAVKSEVLGMSLDKLRLSAIPAFKTYNPQIQPGMQVSATVDKMTGREIFEINRYNPPIWISKPQIKADKLVIPTILDMFLVHLFPIPQNKLEALHWLYHATFSRRSQVILVLCGKQGIGKSIFGDSLCAAMVGRHNHATAPRSLTKKEFNDCYDEKRIVLIEEIDIREEEGPSAKAEVNDRLKAFSNDVISVEGKGIRARTIINFASTVITSNKTKSIPIMVPDERRFLCIETGHTPLKEVMNPELITSLVEQLEDPEGKVVQQFGEWLREFGNLQEEGGEFRMVHSQIKYDMYMSGIPLSMKQVVEHIRKRKEGAREDLELEMNSPLSKLPGYKLDMLEEWHGVTIKELVEASKVVRGREKIYAREEAIREFLRDHLEAPPEFLPLVYFSESDKDFLYFSKVDNGEGVEDEIL